MYFSVERDSESAQSKAPSCGVPRKAIPLVNREILESLDSSGSIIDRVKA